MEKIEKEKLNNFNEVCEKISLLLGIEYEKVVGVFSLIENELFTSLGKGDDFYFPFFGTFYLKDKIGNSQNGRRKSGQYVLGFKPEENLEKQIKKITD